MNPKFEIFKSSDVALKFQLCLESTLKFIIDNILRPVDD